MTTPRWDDYLVAEHELIERAMAVLRAQLERVPGNTHDAFRTGRAIDFLLEFGDQLHNQKEEQHLFPLMQARGIPRQGPIGVMLMEHQAERELLSDLLQRLPGLAAVGDDERATFVAQGQEYLRVRAEHIWKENDILYAMGRQVIADVEGAGLVLAFDALNQATYGAGARDHFAAMVDEIEKGAGAAKPLIHNLSHAQLDAIFEAMPFEVTFVDADDQVAYFNRLDRDKLFPRTRSVVGRKVDKCHPPKSVHMVEQIVQAFKDGTQSEASFWIDFRGDKVLIRYFPVRDRDGKYLGVLEVTQAVGAIQKLQGQQRLLDWKAVGEVRSGESVAGA